MIVLRKTFVTGCILVVLPIFSFAQHFKFTATLDSVAVSGFYTISLSPQLSAIAKTDFADIRIADSKKQWVPHILQSSNTSLVEDLFTEFPIIENAVTDSGKNLLIVHNTKAPGIYNLKLFLKNAAVNRLGVLSGSNDQHKWYIIDDAISINKSVETVKDEYLQEINFPLIKYKYLKIIIDNVHHDPLLITKAGFYEKSSAKNIDNYQNNPVTSFTQKDSNNYTYITVKQDDNYQFDKILLSIKKPKYYSRNVEIYLSDRDVNHNIKPGLLLGNFQLTSSALSQFDLSRIKAKLFLIKIKNGDNPPLIIEKIITQQQTFSLITYLDSDKKYSLFFGDSLASFAEYDLQIFKDSIHVIHPLKYKNIQPVNSDIVMKKGTNENWWIWLSIIFGGFILSYCTYKMVGDINKFKSE